MVNSKMPQANRILVVSWAFPPYHNAQSLHVGRILHHLVELGWEIDVLCVDAKSLGLLKSIDNSLAELYGNSCNIFPLRSGIARNIRSFLGKRIPMLRAIPDDEFVWASKAKSLGKNLLRRKSYFAIISFAQPWSSHLVAMELSRTSGLSWLAHFSDPWADNPYYVGLSNEQGQRMQKLEEIVVREAEKLVFTNLQTADVFIAKYGAELMKKATVIPYGFDRRLRPNVDSDMATGKLHLVYTGSLYGLRNPENLIRGLAQTLVAEDVKLQIAGPVKNLMKYKRLARNLGVEGKIEFLGTLDYPATLKLAAQADVFVLIDAPSKEESLFLPSKLLDYLMFEKPILGITPKRGAAAEILDELDYIVVSPEDFVSIAASIDKLHEDWSNGQLTSSRKHKNVARRYEIKRIARELNKVVKTM